MPDLAMKPSLIESIDVFGNGDLDVVDTVPRPFVSWGHDEARRDDIDVFPLQLLERPIAVSALEGAVAL
ncbi:hypothetical protein ACFWB0_03450 [Rhodococcus sp. NPDC060086]|uniref:hypothetical protein n=1 Tax=unclassified Rhodococcus (in: high G+C Gram-positive bacteria) TaxID=192944 RepID=UPI00365DFE37